MKRTMVALSIALLALTGCAAMDAAQYYAQCGLEWYQCR